MDEIFAQIDVVLLADIGEILRERGAIDRHGRKPQGNAGREIALARLRPLLRQRAERQRIDRGRRRGVRQSRVARRAQHAAAFHAQVENALVLGRGHARDVSVVDRLDEAAFGAAAFEPVAAPARDRHVRHIGVDFHARHQRAGKAEAARDIVIVDLVFRCHSRIEGADVIGRECAHAFLRGPHCASRAFISRAGPRIMAHIEFWNNWSKHARRGRGY